MISELTDKYDACLLLDEIDKFQVEYLRNTYKVCINQVYQVVYNFNAF